MAPWWEMTMRMVLALVLGGVLGWERETRHKPAGLRTLMLVSLAAAVFVLATLEANPQLAGPGDSTRAMAAVAQGIGFLGAGAIMQARGEVRWLTTAASLWAAAALGLAAGLGAYLVAFVGGFLTFVILHWVPLIEDRWIHKSAAKDGAHETGDPESMGKDGG